MHISPLVRQAQRLIAYNHWAWNEVTPSLIQLKKENPQAYFDERPLFWGSLHGLFAHCYAAETIWLQRLNGKSPSHLPNGADFAHLDDILTVWQPVKDQWSIWTKQQTAESLLQEMIYNNTAGQPRRLTQLDILQHVVNHATEHRSQMTPVLYELGVPTDALDFMRWAIQIN